jgi:hypothetical protein
MNRAQEVLGLYTFFGLRINQRETGWGDWRAFFWPSTKKVYKFSSVFEPHNSTK